MICKQEQERLAREEAERQMREEEEVAWYRMSKVM